MGDTQNRYYERMEPTEKECRNCIHWEAGDRTWAARLCATGRCDCPLSEHLGKTTRAVDTCDRYQWVGRRS